jgi:transcriptional regulator with GAF, ATPase, and Fis domain
MSSKDDMSSEKTAGSFEALLVSIATSLLGQPLEFFDASIDDILRRLTAFLGAERSTFGVVDPTDGILRSTHAVAVAPGVVPFPIGQPIAEINPWVFKQLTEKHVPVIISNEGDLPPEAFVDIQTWRASGVRSVAVLPIVAGNQLLGGVSFGSTLRELQWPQLVVDRLQLICEVFAGALLRREHEHKLRATLAEVEALRERLQSENEYLRAGAASAEGFEDIIGESSVLQAVLLQVEHVAPADSTVLLLGETGTGKELIAKAIHVRSRRRDRTLVKVNCAALPPTLIESELFGHEKGAFTGAVSRKIGRFELAHGGSLFLDEIGELPLALQTKLLRVLQEGEFERVGSSVTQKVDVRVIAASNRNLADAAREGTFRSDLYYRLRVFPIEMPPLRARKEDIPLLVWHFLAYLARTVGKRIERVPAATMDRLVAYDWPGNIRELRNVLERAVVLSHGPVLRLDELGGSLHDAVPAPTVEGGARTLEEVEREHILRTLEACGWRLKGTGNAATQLGLNASTLHSRMKKLGIRRPAPGPPRG